MPRFLESTQGHITDTLQNPVTILVIDDDDGIRLVVDRLLKRIGFNVLSIDSGEIALPYVEAGIPNLAAILVDLSMPGMTGDVVVANLARLVPEVPVILMSGYQPEVITQTFANNEVSYYLQKPFTRELLYQAIYTTLDIRHLEPQERAVGL